jgi:hypothetical protein
VCVCVYVIEAASAEALEIFIGFFFFQDASAEALEIFIGICGENAAKFIRNGAVAWRQA